MMRKAPQFCLLLLLSTSLVMTGCGASRYPIDSWQTRIDAVYNRLATINVEQRRLNNANHETLKHWLPNVGEPVINDSTDYVTAGNSIRSREKASDWVFDEIEVVRRELRSIQEGMGD